jgi:hypothetical protein
MTAVNSSRFFGATRAAGRQLCPPDQLRQGISRGAHQLAQRRIGSQRAERADDTARCNN